MGESIGQDIKRNQAHYSNISHLHITLHPSRWPRPPSTHDRQQHTPTTPSYPHYPISPAITSTTTPRPPQLITHAHALVHALAPQAVLKTPTNIMNNNTTTSLPSAPAPTHPSPTPPPKPPSPNTTASAPSPNPNTISAITVPTAPRPPTIAATTMPLTTYPSAPRSTAGKRMRSPGRRASTSTTSSIDRGS